MTRRIVADGSLPVARMAVFDAEAAAATQPLTTPVPTYRRTVPRSQMGHFETPSPLSRRPESVRKRTILFCAPAVAYAPKAVV
jgi:hypothetical protein